MPWSVVEIPLPESLSEAAVDVLHAEGANSAAEEWRGGETYVRGFWHDVPEEEATAAAARALRRLIDAGLLDEAPKFSVSTLEDGDWLEGWKQYFPPLEISPKLAIVPSWESYTPRPGQAVVTLDPGMAFGTGGHGTTATCLQALAAVLAPGMTACDIGTGSGILAIAAVKLGAGRVVAVDNDDLAIRVARSNAQLNGVADIIDFRVGDLLNGVAGPFDLITANILAPVILQLIPQLDGVLAPGGYAITSGYITSQEAEIKAALEAAGHQIQARYEQNDWVTLVSRV
ncbi:MAG: 50S ribosomal protein L11 methyltransferase [Armatimonadota bacterium]